MHILSEACMQWIVPLYWRTFYLWIQVNLSLWFSFWMQYPTHATCSVLAWLLLTLRQPRDQPTLSWVWQWWEGTPGTSNHEGLFLEKPTANPFTTLQAIWNTISAALYGSTVPKPRASREPFLVRLQTLNLNLWCLWYLWAIRSSYFCATLQKLRRCRICFQVSLLSHMPQRGNQTLIEHSWTHTTKVTESRPIELWRTLPNALPLKHTQAQTLYWADWRHIDLVCVTVA